MYSYGSPHMAAQKQDDQHERTFSSYVRIRDVVLKTYLGRWTIGRSGERGSGISVLPARYDDDYYHHYYYNNRLIGLVGWVFANGPGDRGSILGHVIPKTLKTVLVTSLLNTKQDKVRIKGKVKQSWERCRALLDTTL